MQSLKQASLNTWGFKKNNQGLSWEMWLRSALLLLNSHMKYMGLHAGQYVMRGFVK